MSEVIELDLETRIDDAAFLLACAATPAARRDAWAQLKSLVGQRTPERVEQMEIERGLR
jgi:hypothetical protein